MLMGWIQAGTRIVAGRHVAACPWKEEGHLINLQRQVQLVSLGQSSGLGQVVMMTNKLVNL